MRPHQRLLALGAVIVVLGGGGLLAVGVGASSPPADDTTVVTGAPDGAATTTTDTLAPLPVPLPPPTDDGDEPQQYYGRLQIPAIEVDSPFIEGIRISTLDTGPGHWPGTAMPGELGNVFVAGHRTSNNADFRRLDELVPGDEVIFDLDDDEGTPTATVVEPDPYSGVWVYEVVDIEIVAPTDMWVVNQNYRHEATLMACHPPGSISERIVVFLDLKTPLPEPPDPPRTSIPGAPASTLPGSDADTTASVSVAATDA